VFLFFIFYVFLCMMFIIVYHEQNNHEQNLLQFLAGCELLKKRLGPRISCIRKTHRSFAEAQTNQTNQSLKARNC